MSLPELNFHNRVAKKVRKKPSIAVLSKKQRRDMRRRQKDGYGLASEAKQLWEKLRKLD